jgi:hypothetical protein
MSGGSHDYLYRDMQPGGELVPRERALRGLLDDVQRHLTHPDATAWTEVDERGCSYPRGITPEERELAQQAGERVRAKLATMLATLDQLKAQAAELADVAHAIEWADSGDNSTWEVWQAVLKLAEAP